MSSEIFGNFWRMKQFFETWDGRKIFTFHLEALWEGHEVALFISYLYNMQSFGNACIFLYSIPKAFKVFFVFVSYIYNGNSLFKGNISPSDLTNFDRPLIDHLYHVFKLYNLTNAYNLINLLHLELDIEFSHHHSINSWAFSNQHENHHQQL